VLLSRRGGTKRSYGKGPGTVGPRRERKKFLRISWPLKEKGNSMVEAQEG